MASSHPLHSANNAWRAPCIWASPDRQPSRLPGQDAAWLRPCAWSQPGDTLSLPLPEPLSHRTLP
ncbi:hypothetical protein PSQ20_15285 [Curvibacter sp. RS43]|uniref:hypothetical protein n=1 Tax=Curvibacter microcysteis TaxID=3026419 RepID=UPI00235EC46C|nr:hypothetical protein [Curvibacter sp. RS43]MDD0811716.1 hypothetical protein [Curvibacter sp. RS43]